MAPFSANCSPARAREILDQLVDGRAGLTDLSSTWSRRAREEWSMRVHEAMTQLPALLVMLTEIVVVLAGLARLVVCELFRLKAIRLCLSQPDQRRVELSVHRNGCHVSAGEGKLHDYAAPGT